MDDLFHRWLLINLYHFATSLLHYAKRLQLMVRHTLVAYAGRSYTPAPPLTKAVIPWEKRLSEAEKSGKPISAVQHRREMSATLHCHNCGAPSDYLYNCGYEDGHSGDEGFHKIRCKICAFQTVPGRDKRKPHFLCPYCGYSLVKTKERNHFDVLKCKKKHCPYRHDIRLRLEARRNGASPKAKSYIYRSFDLKLTDLQLTRPNKPKIDFAHLRYSTTAVALALTFHIHFGLSLRETQKALLSLYQLPLSHQTIANWCQSVAYLVEPLVSERLEDADILVADETFIRIGGDDAYWWISYNPETATIVSQLVSTNRDTKAAATLIQQSQQQAPQLSYFISDAWDAYSLALLYLGQQQDDVPQHIIVKGLQYQGVPEDAFLWHKELIERFFRTFKQRYRRTLGFASINGAVAFCVLFSVYYNCFRPHQRADGEAPVSIFNHNNVLRNWQQLIQTAIQQT